MRRLAVLLCLAGPCLAAAQAPPSSPTELPALEDAIAQAFTIARASAHLRPLTRIHNRLALRQILCASAVDGHPRTDQLAHESEADSAVLPLPSTFTAADPLPPAFHRVAEYDDRGSARGRRITRFAVAAFSAPGPAGAPAEPFVGVALYWSRATEFFAIRVSKSFYPQNLSGTLPPACAALR